MRNTIDEDLSYLEALVSWKSRMEQSTNNQNQLLP